MRTPFCPWPHFTCSCWCNSLTGLLFKTSINRTSPKIFIFLFQLSRGFVQYCFPFPFFAEYFPFPETRKSPAFSHIATVCSFFFFFFFLGGFVATLNTGPFLCFSSLFLLPRERDHLPRKRFPPSPQASNGPLWIKGFSQLFPVNFFWDQGSFLLSFR